MWDGKSILRRGKSEEGAEERGVRRCYLIRGWGQGRPGRNKSNIMEVKSAC